MPSSLARSGALAILVCGACIDDVELPPKPPTVQPVGETVTVPVLRLSGTRPANTAVLLGEVEVVPAGTETAWSHQVTLVPGPNRFEFWTKTVKKGLRSSVAAVVAVSYEPVCPGPVVLAMVPPSPTRLTTHTIVGTKPKGTAVLLNDREVVAANDTGAFTHELSLPMEGAHSFSWVARDARGKKSDPVRLTVVLDTTVPQLVSRYPTGPSDDAGVANTDIATNAAIDVELSESLRTVDGQIPPDVVTVRAGAAPVAGTTAYLATASTITWTPTAALAPNTVHTVSVDAAELTDLAGNAAAAGTTWTWSFTTGAAPLSNGPSAPTAAAPPTVSTPDVTVDGSRSAWSSIWINDKMVVPPGPGNFRVKVPVARGASTLVVDARGPSGIKTPGPTLQLTRTVNKPAPPSVDAEVATMVSTSTVTLTGTKPPGTAVLISGRPITCVNDEGTWAAVVELSPGVNDMRLTTRNAEEELSDEILFSVNFGQTYSGKVPGTFKLQLAMNFRDLAGSAISGEFSTAGPNHYSVDVWLEGPLAVGEVCKFDSAKKQRTDVKYVATIARYVGSGSRVNPFADDDYRVPDYLAALAHGRLLESLGVNPDSPRRDANGRLDGAILMRLTTADLKTKIDCLGQQLGANDSADGCTEATIDKPQKTLRAWSPRRLPNGTLLDQGEYMLWVILNLDRSGSWLTGNDTEVCWGNPSDSRRGMHRVVRRVSLADKPWTVTVTPADELSGPDPDGAADLRYLAAQGMTITWGP